MEKTMMLGEGMRGGDLEDLVLPMISVDEFESKISDEAMVFGFFVSDKEAANELNRFIQKSPIRLLATEVSPAPDQKGFYVLFVEVNVTDRLPATVARLLDEMKPLVLIDRWKMQMRGKDELIPFSKETLTRFVKQLKQDKAKKEKKKEKPKTLAERVLEFLRPSGLSGAQADETFLVLEAFGQRATFEVVAFGPANVVGSTMARSPLDVSLTDTAKEVRLGRMLGEGWVVARIDGLSVLQHDNSDAMLLLKDR